MLKLMRYFGFLFLFFYCLNLYPQFLAKENWQIEADLFFGEIQKPDDLVKQILKDGTTRTYDIKLGYINRKDSIFASLYNYPTLGIGFSAIDFSSAEMYKAPHHLGNIYTLYGYINRNLICMNRVKFKYMFESGIAYNTDIYDQYDNSNKIFSSFPFMFYVSLGLGLKYNISDRLEIGINTKVKHLSNGRVGIVNKGINIVGTDLSMSYHFSPIICKYPKTMIPPHKKHFYYHVVAGSGVETYLEDLIMYSYKPANENQGKRTFKLYPKHFISSDISYRLSRKYGCGLGIDLFYVPNTSSFQEYDKIRFEEKSSSLKYDPLSMGISFNQEIYFNNLALTSSFGYYLYRELGVRDDERPFYQRAGFRYYFPKINNLFIGSSIKAHNFNKAEYIEFSIGKKFKE